MKKTFSILSLVLLLIGTVSSCSSKKITFDYDSSADFSGIKTFQWDEQTSSEFAQANPLIDARIIKAVETSLSSKGLSKADAGDVKVSYSVSFEKKLSSGGLSAGIGMSVGSKNRGQISLSSGNKLRETTEGTLVLDMVTVSTDTLIWRSMSTQKIPAKASSPEKSEQRINTLVSEMLENYPPSPAK